MGLCKPDGEAALRRSVLELLRQDGGRIECRRGLEPVLAGVPDHHNCARATEPALEMALEHVECLAFAACDLQRIAKGREAAPTRGITPRRPFEEDPADEREQRPESEDRDDRDGRRGAPVALAVALLVAREAAVDAA